MRLRKTTAWRRAAALAATAVLGCSALTGCGLSTSAAIAFDIKPGKIKPIPGLEGVQVKVGSKDFTEQILLGYITEIALDAAGADVQDVTNIHGSTNSRLALRTGDVDVSWEYTGTAWMNYQGNTKPIPNERQQYDEVKKADAEKFGISWLNYSPVNNHYVFVLNEKNQAELKLNTLSDLVEAVKRDPSKSQFCVETEFASRPDGFPGMQAAYGMPPPRDIKTFGTGTIYSATGAGNCIFGEGYETDSRILTQKLHLLRDDKQFFPQYSAAPTVRTEFLDKHPQLRGVLDQVSPALNNDVIRELGRKVDAEGQDPAKVARDWMVSQGFIGR